MLSLLGRKTHFKLLLPLLLAGSLVATAQSAVTGNKGTDFWVAIPDNANLTGAVFQLMITSSVIATGTVQIPGIAFSTPFAVPAGSTAVVTLPAGALVTSTDGITAQGIHITSTAPVAVYGFEAIPFASDGYLALPTNALDTGYMVSTYSANLSTAYGSLFAVVAAQNATAVTITPSKTVGVRTAGVPYVVNLNQGDVYQLVDYTLNDDLTGSLIQSSNPVAVFGASMGSDVPTAATASANSLVEQLWPLSDWGDDFFTVPLATRLNGDTFTITASANGTSVSINGALVASLNAGQVYQQEVSIASQITSNNPVYVMQFANGDGWDGNSNA